MEAGDELRGLWEEAAGDAELDPFKSQRENVLRLIYCVFHITGSINFPRGWIGEMRRQFAGAGLDPPSPNVCRWYRSKVAGSSEMIADYPWVDPGTLSDLDELGPAGRPGRPLRWR